MSMKKRGIWGGAVVLGVAVATFVAAEKHLNADDDLYRELKPLMESMAIIQNNYVDADKVKSKELVEGAIKGMMGQLDPFSQYMDPQENADMGSDTKGSFGGLGIEISQKEKVLVVVSPIEDTPADKAGVKAGDAILKIDGVSTDGVELMDAVHKMRGEPGTKVTITVWHEGMAAPKDLAITRAVIKIRSVKSNLLDGQVGYIRLSTFMGKSAEDFGTALDQLESQGAQSLVIDVRNNPGGLLNAAADIAGHFVPKGKVIVSTASRYKDRDMEFDSDGGDLWTKPTVILINGGSASASEILAGCLQDYGLAVVVGTKSFGKGSVQTILPLSDGAGLRLTTAKYLTPKGHSLHGVGVTPDVASDEEPLAKLTQDLVDADCYSLFWKDYLVEHPAFSFKEGAAKSAVKVSESSWQVLKPETKEDILLKEFGDWLAGHGHAASMDDLARDKQQLLGKLREELARKQGGEDAARVAALDEDPQVKAALGVLKVEQVMADRGKSK